MLRPVGFLSRLRSSLAEVGQLRRNLSQEIHDRQLDVISELQLGIGSLTVLVGRIGFELFFSLANLFSRHDPRWMLRSEPRVF